MTGKKLGKMLEQFLAQIKDSWNKRKESQTNSTTRKSTVPRVIRDQLNTFRLWLKMPLFQPFLHQMKTPLTLLPQLLSQTMMLTTNSCHHQMAQLLKRNLRRKRLPKPKKLPRRSKS